MKHYTRWRRHGDPNIVRTKSGVPSDLPLSERIERQVTKTDADCWEWTGTRNNRGYGVITVNRRRVYVHRLSLEGALGRPLGDGMEAAHRCDNPPCCNPAHLFEATHRENMLDSSAKGRACGGVAIGEEHPNALLTDTAVREIRQQRGHETGPMLAARFGVSESAIYAVWSGRLWGHVR